MFIIVHVPDNHAQIDVDQITKTYYDKPTLRVNSYLWPWKTSNATELVQKG